MMNSGENNTMRNATEIHGKLVAISGPSGSGKGTVIKELYNLNEYKYSVSATTRKPRAGEIDGIDYYFITEDEFLKKISDGDMLEYVEYSGNHYGTLREPVERMLRKGYSVILEIEIEGALNIKEKYPEAVMVFLIPPTYIELEKRLRERGTESEEVIIRRMERAKWEINSIARYDYLVVNEFEMYKKAAFNINCIVEYEKYKNSQPPNISISKETEKIFKIAEESKLSPEKTEEFLKHYFA